MPASPPDSDRAAAAFQEAERRIAQWQRRGLTSKGLDLSGLGLTTLPESIGQLSSLTQLVLYNNQLSTLPESIGQLAALRELHLQGNQLRFLPESIGQLSVLNQLHLQFNQLSTLPESIGQPTALTRLNLYNNQLRTLPESISQLSALKELNLDDNQLSTLPESIGQLSALKELRLDNNQLSTLPESIGQLSTLTHLFLHNNPGLGIPDSVLGPTLDDLVDAPNKSPADPATILKFYFEQRRAQQAGAAQPLREIKVMLVGRGGAGKTSLRRFFLGQRHDTKEPETPGIALDAVPVACHGRQVTMRLWDFAGQEITHALHQFFLTEGCVYLVVLDPRSNTEGKDAAYWLGHIERYGGSAPTLLVLNRQDARPGGYGVDRNALKQRFPFIRGFVPTNCADRSGCAELMAQLCRTMDALPKSEPPWLEVPKAWLQIKDECFREGARAQGRTKRGSLLQQVRAIFQMAEPEDELPARPWLKMQDFRIICDRHGEQSPPDQDILAKLLHKLGAVLHFADDERLRDTAVLNPHWVTDGVYRLMRWKEGPQSDGVLSLTEALKALDDRRAPDATPSTEADARFLLRLMERFQMAFSLDEEAGPEAQVRDRWMVPGALTPFQPADIGTGWEDRDAVRLRFAYKPLPEGVVPRFIVMTHPLSEGLARWRRGVVLEREGARLLLRRGLDEEENTLFLTALGTDEARLALLQIAQAALATINADLPGGRPEPEIELPMAPGTWRRLADLAAAEDRDPGTLPVRTTSGEDVQVPAAQVLNAASSEASRDEDRVPLNVFVSYAHENKRALAVFQQNLLRMQGDGLIKFWTDEALRPSDEWRKDIETQLEKMDMFIGLISTDFFASDFIKRVETKRALERMREHGVPVVLVMLEDIDIRDPELKKLHYLKPENRAVSDWSSLRKGFNAVEKIVAKQIEDMQAQRRGPRERD